VQIVLAGTFSSTEKLTTVALFEMVKNHPASLTAQGSRGRRLSLGNYIIKPLPSVRYISSGFGMDNRAADLIGIVRVQHRIDDMDDPV
jgi:hypothetical protein